MDDLRIIKTCIITINTVKMNEVCDGAYFPLAQGGN